MGYEAFISVHKPVDEDTCVDDDKDGEDYFGGAEPGKIGNSCEKVVSDDNKEEFKFSWFW